MVTMLMNLVTVSTYLLNHLICLYGLYESHPNGITYILTP